MGKVKSHARRLSNVILYISKRMKKNLVVLIAVLFSQILFSQEYKSEFQKHWQTGDTLNQRKVLNDWERSNPKDPELFTSYFNFHLTKSQQEVVVLSTEELEGEGFVLKDSLNQTAGYMGSRLQFEPAEVQKAFNRIDRGIKLYPNRLDMRFGKIFALGILEDWDFFTSEIIKAIQQSAINNNDWIWMNNEKQEGGRDFFLSSLQDYQVQLYETGNDNLLINMRNIANEVLEYYPDHIESLSNLSITYFLTGEFDKGLEPLLKAEKINPEDDIVLFNIAHGYKLKGDSKKAIEYYEKTILFGDEETQEFAKQQIAELKSE